MSSFSIALTRALVGLAQGIALYLLYRASETGGWPATEPLVFAGLLVPAVFVPVMVVAGMGNLRARTLAVWALLAAAICAGLGLYDIFRDPLSIYGATAGRPRIAPSPALWACLGLVLFIGHALIVSAEAERKFVASYARHFDVSWKHGVQLALAASFVGAFWALLFLSAELFRLIGIRYLIELIERPWFYAPATTVVLAYAIHVTDTRTELVRGVRTLTLTLLARLLPMMTALALAFLLALPFTGLQPLWNTQRATATLLVAAAALIFLITATDARCEAILLDLDGDGGLEVVLFALRGGGGTLTAGAFKAGTDQRWTGLGGIANIYCPGVREALAAGQVKAVEPRLKEIDLNGIRLRIADRGCANPYLRGPLGIGR